MTFIYKKCYSKIHKEVCTHSNTMKLTIYLFDKLPMLQKILNDMVLTAEPVNYSRRRLISL